MSVAEVDAYIDALEEPKRTTLRELRSTILSIIPDAEQVISYRMPAFKVDGRVVAGFAAFQKHLAYLPHSGSLFNALEKDLAGYTRTAGSLHFAIDKPLPKGLVKQLIDTRRRQIRGEKLT